MIYIATVHWKDPRWIALQDKMLRKFVPQPWKKFGFLNAIDQEYYHSFDLVRDDQDDPVHEEKLDILAAEILHDSTSDDDWMVFLDGDAFPINDIGPSINTFFEEYPLVAVQRLENLRELQPHPCFCVTTVGFWKEINGTWKRGYQWRNQIGRKVTDVGGNLLGTLDRRDINWKTLHRSNTVNYHPLLFGVYDDLVYHHGAGFRFIGNSIDYYRFGHYGLWYRMQAAVLERIIPKQWLRSIRLSVIHPLGRLYRKVRRHNEEIYNTITANILADENVIYELIQPRDRVDNRYKGWEKVVEKLGEPVSQTS